VAERRESCPLKLSREALEAFWSSVIYDPDARMSDRLRASELAAKSCGMFLERPDPPKVQMTTEEAKAEILQANRVIARAGLLTAEDLGEFRVYVPDDGSGPPLLTSEAP
jgi:hypothetical protein